ncbi:MAG: hypothetical protein QXH26_04225 [Candidatus Hadarchaeales archaeon]
MEEEETRKFAIIPAKTTRSAATISKNSIAVCPLLGLGFFILIKIKQTNPKA